MDKDSSPPWIDDDRGDKPNDKLPFLNYEQKKLKSTDKTWYYHDKLRYYLLAIAKDKNALESIYKFPDFIIPPKSWGKLFNKMIKSTKETGHEWFSFIATDMYGSVLLPNLKYTLKGNEINITSEMQMAHEDLLREIGADRIVGSIHTHPSKHRFKSLVDRFSLFSAFFSVQDLYALVIPNDESVMVVLQNDGQSVFAFRSRETHLNEELAYLPHGYRNQQFFSDYWYRSVGLTYERETQTARPVDNRQLSHDEWLKLVWKAAVNVAEKHNLAMYRGHVGYRLQKEYPTV